MTERQEKEHKSLPDERVQQFAEELRKWWSFDRQHHTHSWHDREDFIEKKLPELLAAFAAATKD